MKVSSLLSSAAYRVSVLALTILFAFGIFYMTLGTRPRIDAVPAIKPITPEQYNAWGQYADILNSGMFMTNFAVADFPQGQFIVDAFIWLQFNPLVFSLDTVSQFTFDKGRILEKEFIESIKVGDDLFVRYRVRFEVKSNLNFKYFPLDSHRIYAVLKYDSLSPSEVIVTSSFSRTWFGSNAVSFNWAYGEPASDFGYLESTLDSRNKDSVNYTSVASTYFDFERATIREGVLVLLPFIMLLLLIFGSLLMALTSCQALIFAAMGILGMLIYRIVLNHMAPMTSYYMLSDCVFLLALACSMVVVIFEIINAVYSGEEEELFNILRGVTLTLASMIFLVGWFYLLYLW